MEKNDGYMERPEDKAVKISTLNASEALYGFCGWITTRETPVTASSKHDAGVWAGLVSEFAEENCLPDARIGWDDILKHPVKELKHG